MARASGAKKPRTPTKKAPARGVGGARQKADGDAKVQKKPESTKPPVSVDLVQARADFVRYYIEQDFRDATGAYKRAYGEKTDEVAASAASRLLKDVKIQEALSGELEATLKERRRPLEKRVLDTWIVRAFYDPTEIIDLHGRLKITEAELRRRGLQVCIDSINVKRDQRGKQYIEYKLADRDKALDMLQRYIAMIREPKEDSERETAEAFRLLKGVFDAVREGK